MKSCSHDRPVHILSADVGTESLVNPSHVPTIERQRDANVDVDNRGGDEVRQHGDHEGEEHLRYLALWI